MKTSDIVVDIVAEILRAKIHTLTKIFRNALGLIPLLKSVLRGYISSTLR